MTSLHRPPGRRCGVSYLCAHVDLAAVPGTRTRCLWLGRERPRKCGWPPSLRFGSAIDLPRRTKRYCSRRTLAGSVVGGRGLMPSHLVGVLLVAMATRAILDHLGHGLGGRLPLHTALARTVQVAGDGRPMELAPGTPPGAWLWGTLGDGRVMPVQWNQSCSEKGGLPVDHAGSMVARDEPSVITPLERRATAPISQEVGMPDVPPARSCRCRSLGRDGAEAGLTMSFLGRRVTKSVGMPNRPARPTRWTSPPAIDSRTMGRVKRLSIPGRRERAYDLRRKSQPLALSDTAPGDNTANTPTAGAPRGAPDAPNQLQRVGTVKAGGADPRLGGPALRSNLGCGPLVTSSTGSCAALWPSPAARLVRTALGSSGPPLGGHCRRLLGLQRPPAAGDALKGRHLGGGGR